MKIFKMLFISLIFLLLVVVFTDCSKKSQPIKLGLICDQTGALGLYGKWVYEGSQIAVDEINQHFKNKVKLIVEDSQSDPKIAVNALTKLINVDKVKFIISGNGSGSVMAMAPIANKNKVILFVTLASSPSITNAGDYIFRNRISGLFEIKEMARLTIDKLRIKKVAIVVYDNEAGKAYIEAFKEKFENLGGNLAESVLLSPNNTNFQTSILKIKAKNPPAVFTVLPVKQAAQFIKQSTELGLRVQWLGVSSLNSDLLFKIAGNSVNGLIIASEGVNENNEIYKVFKKAYNNLYHKNPTIYSVNGYDAVKILVNLINRYGYDVEKVKNSLYHLKGFYGAGGKLIFDRNGDVIKNIVLLKAENNEFKKIWVNDE